MNSTEVLDIKFQCYDLGREVTIREYMKELLIVLIEEDEGFSGKRPFGNSGWICDLAHALVFAGVVKGEVHEYDDGDGEIAKEASGYSWSEVKTVLIRAITEAL